MARLWNIQILRLIRLTASAVVLLTLLTPLQGDTNSFLQIKNGYFWDSGTGNYFVPRGIAYQLWNPPVGANQSFDQLTYDLVEFKKIRANSVRCEMVWGELEIAEGVYDWSKPDYLVAEAERLGLKLFVLIGFQYPPAWFPGELRAINSFGLTPERMRALSNSTPAAAWSVFDEKIQELFNKAISKEHRDLAAAAMVRGARKGTVTDVLEEIRASLPPLEATEAVRLLISDVINYEHPQARAAYVRHLAAVTARYKNSTAIGGWIMGNEYAYFDLWEDPTLWSVHRFLGYDTISQESFRNYLRATHGNNISALNERWGTDYIDFSEVGMPDRYPDDRNDPAHFDLIQWRMQSIGDFVGAGAAAARKTDPNHLQTYSMVGGIFNGRDANNTCEDAPSIVRRCSAAGAPLDFWSINNYANASLGSELRSADYGIAKYQDLTGLPVMISETGHSSTEDLFDFPDAGARQAKAAPGQIWESLISGAIGTHLFHWNDRSQFTQGYFLRERGFGIVEQNRAIKPAVYTNTVNMFRRMDEIRLDNLLGGASNPPANLHLFWSTNSDMVWPRANQENAMLWGALKRLGYQPRIIDDRGFANAVYTNAKALILSRAYQLGPAQLEMLATRVLPSGVHIHANADLPGQYDQYHRTNGNWAAAMENIFGIDSSKAYRGLHAIVTNDFYAPILFLGAADLGPLARTYSASAKTWEIWHDIPVKSGTTIVSHGGYNQSQPGTPALVVKAHPKAKTALNTFALGDTFPDENTPKEGIWAFRYQWLKAIYQSYFQIPPVIQLTGNRADQVMPDYRVARNGSILISLLNEGTNSVNVTVAAPALLQGKTVENLTTGGIVENNSNGFFTLAMAGDDYTLLYAYDEAGPAKSLIDSSPARLWFESAPVIVHSRPAPYSVVLGYDTRAGSGVMSVSLRSAEGRVLAQSAAVAVQGTGSNTVEFTVPDPDLEDASYKSSVEGGRYFLKASLQSATGMAERDIPLRLGWSVLPTAPLPQPVPGNSYSIGLKWEELPSPDPLDPTRLDRAALWDSLNALKSCYAITLKILGRNGTVAATSEALVRSGSGETNLAIFLPGNAQGPFSWSAELRPVTSLASHDVWESFEGRDRGAKWPDALTTDFFAPFGSFKYPLPEQVGIDLWQNEGVHLIGSHGSQSAFLVATNPPGLDFAEFGLGYVFETGPWGLPADRSQWTNFVFSFDFKEMKNLPAQLEMQIKNEDPAGTGKWLQFSAPHTPGTDGWTHVRATLDQFQPPLGLFGVFDPSQASEIVVAVIMKQPSAQYVGAIDNIRFDGPDTILATGPVAGVYTSANDSAGFLLAARTGEGRIRITWSDSGKLARAPRVDGPFEPVANATSPFDATGMAGFYRLER